MALFDWCSRGKHEECKRRATTPYGDAVICTCDNQECECNGQTE